MVRLTSHQKCFLCPKILPENYDKGNICEECAKDQEKFETRFDTYYGSQEKVDELRKSIIENPSIYEGIWNIRLTKDSPDSDIAKVLMLQHEVIEEEDFDMEIEDCDLIE